MTTKIPVIRERRAIIRLYELDENLKRKSKKSKPLCELSTFQTTFALNSIPVATVTPLLGENIQTKDKQLAFDKIYQLANKSAPVGVYLSFIHRTKSSTDRTDKQYWPKKEVCIFKGYLSIPNFSLSAYEASMGFEIHHWLSALANVSLLTTASSVSNPDQIAMAVYGLAGVGTPASWGNFTLPEGVKLSQLWEKGIKQLFLKVLDRADQLNKGGKLNAFVEQERKRIRIILDKIQSSSLEIDKSLVDGVLKLNTLIAVCLTKDSYASFINTCGWTKLIKVYAPNFLFSVVPQVDSVKIIPAPCIINKKKAIEINGDDIFQLSGRPYVNNHVSRVICTSDKGTTQATTAVGNVYYVNHGIYPPEGIPSEGILTVVTIPPWLTNTVVAPVDPKFPSVFEKLAPKVEKVEKNQKKVKDVNKIQNRLIQAFAAYVYLSQTYAGAVIDMALPGRMDICPGAMIKVYAKGSKADVEFYGTVATVQINLSAGSTPATTVLQITNIRTTVDIDDAIKNPQKDVGFYKENWSGQGEVLYAEE